MLTACQRTRWPGDGPAIEARGLVKVYGETRALDGIDLTVRRGQVFGFLGPNGAARRISDIDTTLPC
jgi:ABC-type lipopolysaccharide export system ATPase subunit